MVKLVNSDPAVLDALVTSDESWIYCYDQDIKRQSSQWLSQTQEGQTEQTRPQTFDDPFFDSIGMIYMHWVPTGPTVNKEYYVEVLMKFRKRSVGRGQHSSNRVNGIS